MNLESMMKIKETSMSAVVEHSENFQKTYIITKDMETIKKIVYWVATTVLKPPSTDAVVQCCKTFLKGL